MSNLVEGTAIEGDERRGVDRRTLIKRAAAAGAVAWAAPMIIDSVASPAAAESSELPSGDFLFYFLVNWTSGSCAVTLLSTATQGNFTTTTCAGTRVECGNPGSSVIQALFNGTVTPIDGCSASTAACPGLAGPPPGPNQGLCFSSTQANATITNFDVSSFNVATNPAGVPGSTLCLTAIGCSFGTGSQVFASTNTNPSGTTAIVAIRVHVT